MTDEIKETAPTLVVEYQGRQLTATLPEVFAALAAVLPIATKLFGSKKERAVNSRDLHKALEVVRDHSTWMAGVLTQYDLVENEDYVVERLDKLNPENWPAIKANGGKVPTVYLFKPEVAAKIATLGRTKKSKEVWAYMYAVTDAAHDAVVAHYQTLQAQAAIALENKEQNLQDVVQHLGFDSVNAAMLKGNARLEEHEARDTHEQVLAKKWKNLCCIAFKKLKPVMERKDYKEANRLIVNAYDDMKRGENDEPGFIGDCC